MADLKLDVADEAERWTVRGVTREARERAKTMADLMNKPVGTWLTDAIMGVAGTTDAPRTAGGHQDTAPGDLLATAIANLGSLVATLAPLNDRLDGETRVEIGRTVRVLARQVRARVTPPRAPRAVAALPRPE